MTSEIKTRKKGFDLYIFRDGHWDIYKNYIDREREKAENTASILQKTGEYVGICLVDHQKRDIIFNHNTRGDRLTYTLITSGGTQGKVVQANTDNIRKARTVDRSGPKSPLIRLVPLAIVLISLVLAKMIYANNQQATFPVVIAVFGFIIALIIYMKQTQDDRHNEEDEHDNLERKWQAVDGITKESIYEFRKYCEANSEKDDIDDSHFGAILIAIGIGDGFIKYNNLPREEVEERIIAYLDSEGIYASGVSRVWENIYEYLMYPRYKKMYDKGKSIAKIRGKNLAEDVNISDSATEWLGKNLETTEDAEANVSSVLFTDIVDFTSSQQRHGDEWMVDVIKAHNDIVRTALKSFQGREVKHTGDGIMASFPSALLAAQAAQAMQRGFIKFAEAVPARSFDVRVGISAGKPIHMGDDIFGTPVNLAARVMSHGQGRDIMLAQSAYEICKDSDHMFNKVTGCKLKGFDGDHTLYRINCDKEKSKAREDMGDSFMEPEKSSFIR